METKPVLVISDNEELLKRFRKLAAEKQLSHVFRYAYSSINLQLKEKYSNELWINSIDIKHDYAELPAKYKMIISLHCKQLFPAELVKTVKCINVHPGLNPYNRGWFPQVFSIINGLPAGATVHEIDEQLDHGPVIAQKPVKIESWDTSLSAYNKILDAEISLLTEHLENIITGSYVSYNPEEGNINLKKDFNALCHINRSEQGTFGEHINRLRALTHGDYSNAWFIDDEGNKVFIHITLKKANP